MHPQSIIIQCYRDDEPIDVQVRAYVKNHIALHRSIPDPRRGWALTHNNVVLAGPVRASQQKALDWLERVAALPIDWSKDIYIFENLKHLKTIPTLLEVK